QDQATFIQQAIDDVLSSALIGGLVSVLVLLLFLRHVWSTFVIGLSIPLSVIATFGGLYGVGVSMNIMSLGGLALGIGMLVDNSIVVLESIMRFREEGMSAPKAALKGTREVAGAVTASTLTTVCVFLPIVFLEGVAGQMLRDLAWTVVISLGSSLVVSIFFIPMLLSLSWETQEDVTEPVSWPQGLAWSRWKQSVALWKQRWGNAGAFGRISWIVLGIVWWPFVISMVALQWVLDVWRWCWFGFTAALLWSVHLAVRMLRWVFGVVCWPLFRGMEWGLGILQWGYPRLLGASLRQPLGVVLVLLLLGGGIWWNLGALETSFLPRVRQGSFVVEAAFAVGTPLEKTALRMRLIENDLSKIDGVADVFTTIGVEKTEV
ncbi:MAG: efflux RND transporter permease subunit, partial [Myxococcota bacterium]